MEQEKVIPKQEPQEGKSTPARPAKENTRSQAEPDAPGDSGADSGPDADPGTPESPQTPEPALAAQPPEPAEPAQPAECAALAEPAEPAQPAGRAALAEPAESLAAAPADPDGEDTRPPMTPEQQAEEERRLAEMTRTVQVSIEQIMEAAGGQAAGGSSGEAPGPADGADSSDTDHEEPDGAPNGFHRATVLLLRWLLLVVVVVAVIAGAGLVWLYRQATPDMIPAVTVTFDGQEVQPSSYRWQVPVAGNLIKRTYRDTVSSRPTVLETPVESAGIDLTVSPSDLRTQLTVENAAGESCFTGTVQQFHAFRFEQNGDYTARLVVSNAQGYAEEASVTGSQTYELAFTVDIRPTVRLNTQSAAQGGVVALIVSGAQSGGKPILTSQLSATDFYEGTRGWVAYLPIPCDAEAKDYPLRVQTGDYTQTLTLTVRARSGAYRDYTSKSQLTKPYVGSDNTPREVADLLDVAGSTLYWTETGFSSPFTRSMDITLPYGTTEYLNRTREERAKGTGTGRTSVNAVLSGSCELVAPAAGKVLLARELDGVGNTLIIEHGAGVKTIFYGLKSLDVEEGDLLRRGQNIGMTAKSTVVEVRIGQTPVEPLSILRGQCDALKNY